jgi:SAM-dependent methyltransferase
MVTPLRRRLHRIARSSRSALLRLASPIDRVALVINGKAELPPIHLRRQSGPLNAFERAAAEYVGLLSALADLKPSSRILDVGCGAGAMAIMLRDRLGPDGSYLGFDVDEPSIRWCQAHLAGGRFVFRNHDYWNATYRPSGVQDQPWPVEDGQADIVILKSLFTHMLPDDIAFYVRELRRALAPSGTALVTAFAYAAVDQAVQDRFRFEGGGFRYARAGAPEAAVAYSWDWLLGLFTDNGLAAESHPGFWRPQETTPLAYQDVLIARHAGAAGRDTRP